MFSMDIAQRLGAQDALIMGNIIPITTSAAKAIKTVLPELAGRVSGISVRLPTANLSMVDMTELFGVLQVENEELVSSDFLGNSCSAIIDSKALVGLKPNFFDIIAWYDDEWAYRLM
ncbi:hypothetical protein BPOR_0666g00020 [Botrytis porri]|uniref:Glyceraldehyde 3-phosphate dehydrogenase catalytic domain-containing protein n=1 Tax=Botrytis porri TaxID=87229 RepID=A0A4Z1KB59_9HELO|nr:hypothetical protein BPOR_0666g00020 [Botrytis porri]